MNPTPALRRPFCIRCACIHPLTFGKEPRYANPRI